jgi:hypothetical protein
MKITDDKDFPLFIQAYRTNILVKYGEKNLSHYPEFQSLSRDKIERMTRYFLELLYPEWEERIRLDDAFQSLKGFVSKPSKVFGLIGSLGLSLWKIGKYLPESFRAGVAALSSYLTAHKMEAQLLNEAKINIQSGRSLEDEAVFKSMLATIPKAEAEEFRKDTVALFRTLTNQELVDRIIHIMENLIDKMKEKPNIYNQKEIDGISLGLSILIQGRAILDTLSDGEKDLMLVAIDRIEKDYYESCLR